MSNNPSCRHWRDDDDGALLPESLRIPTLYYGSCDEEPKIGIRAALDRIPLGHKAVVEESKCPTLTPEVKAFIDEHGLHQLLEEASQAIEAAFGSLVGLVIDLALDSEEGDASLSVRIPVENYKKGNKCFNVFCHSWWYDKIGLYSRLIGFDVVKFRGV